MHSKKRIVTFLFIICSILLFSSLDTVLGQSTQKNEERLSNQLSPMATITFNPNIRVVDPDYERVTLEQVNEIANLESVKAVEYHLGVDLYNQNLKLPYEKVNGIEIVSSLPVTQFITQGVSHSKFALLKEEIIILKEGRSFNDEELQKSHFKKVPILISKDFAKMNHLTVGSEFSLDNNVYFIPLYDTDWDFDEVYVDSNIVAKETYEFNVVGIFTPNKVDEVRAGILSNKVFVPETFVESALNFALNKAHDAHKQVYQNESWWDDYEIEYQFKFQNQKASNPLFILEDSFNWEQFELEANKILSPSHQIQRVTNSNVYELF